MDHDYELEDDYAPRILWGRLAFFGVALLLAFIVGRSCAPDGVSTETYNTEKQRVVELVSENQVLEAQLSAMEQGNNAGNNNNGGNNNGGGGKNNNNAEATEEPTDESVGEEGETYTVQSGDTLTTIAERVYGDATAYDIIVDANNLDSTTGLRVGQELIIPPRD